MLPKGSDEDSVNATLCCFFFLVVGLFRVTKQCDKEATSPLPAYGEKRYH